MALTGAGLALCLGAGSAGAALALSLSDEAEAVVADTVPKAVDGASTSGALADVAAAVQPSVVSIEVTTRQGRSEGSGVVLREDGMILTNNHVAGAEGAGLVVTFADGERAPATLVGADPATDLAVIKVSGVDNLVPATFAAGTDSLAVGDTVLAIGSPLGLAGSVTAGIVSALHRSVDLGSSGRQTASVLADAIQTDAAINPGNSGGPLVDTSGRVVGINTAIASLSGSGSIGLGFAIRVEDATTVAEALMAGEQPAHAVLGVTAADTPQGALLHSVETGSAADAAGLRAGDVITAFGDRSLGGGRMSLASAVRVRDPGDRVRVTYTRDGAERTVEVVLGSSSA
jgi:putative serine protease PepD